MYHPHLFQDQSSSGKAKPRERKSVALYIRNGAGFTLIELVIYLALFAVIMTGALSGMYSLIESGARNQAQAMVQEEGTFLLGKIDWVLTNTKDVTNPITTGATLDITRFNGTVATVDLWGGNLRLADSGTPAQVLNNSNVAISGLTFTHTEASADGINPESIQAFFTLEAKTSDGLAFSRTFSTLKYLRK